MLPILRDQLDAYGNRSAGLVPGQAGAGSSTIGGTISIYAVGANLIWAVLGLPRRRRDGPDRRPVAAADAARLVLLGRGRSGRSMLLLALVVVPMAALFVVGSMKRDLFELRYFSGAVPAMLLLGARVVTATTVPRGPRRCVAGGCVAATMLVVGLVDQQLNGANPRLYDFEGALDRDQRARRAGRRHAVRAVLPRRGRRLLRARTSSAGPSASPLPTATGRCGCSPPSGCSTPRTPRPGSARARRARAGARRSSTLRTPQRPGVGAAMTDRSTTRDSTTPSLRPMPPAWDAGDPGRGAASRATVLAARQHGRRSSLLLLVAAAPGARRQPGAVRRAHRRRAVQRRAGARVLVDVPRRRRRAAPAVAASTADAVAVDVFIPTYSEPVEVVEATVAAATRLRGAGSTSPLLDDGNREEMEQLAPATASATSAARSTGRQGRQHQPRPRPHRRAVRARARLRPRARTRTSSSARCPSSPTTRVAFVQTPQYYANAGDSRIAGGGVEPAGAVLRADRPRQGRPRRDVLLRHQRRVPARGAGGGRRLPEGSLTEDFALSVDLHERGWRVGVRAGGAGQRARPGGPGVLRQPAAPLGAWLPRRRSRACCARAAAARTKLQYLLSASYFLSGWTVLVYLSLPVDPHPHRRPAARRRRRRQLPRRIRARTSCCRWPRSPASAPAPTRSPPTRWRPRRSGSTSTPRIRVLRRRAGGVRRHAEARRRAAASARPPRRRSPPSPCSSAPRCRPGPRPRRRPR